MGHKSDLSEMHGPIYKQAPVKHSYTGGYIGTRASSAEKEQLEKQKALVGKFFKQEAKTRSKSETRVEKKTEMFTSTQSSSHTQSSSQQVTMVQGRETRIMEAKQAGLERKQEALKRREDFVSSQTTTTVDGNIMSTQEIRDINSKREELIRQEVLKIQMESKMMMERYMLECKRRNDQLEQEQELRRRKAEADKKEQQRLKMQQEKQNMGNKQSDKDKKDAERREYEKKQAEARKAEEDIRRREMERLETLRRKEEETVIRQKAEMSSIQNVDLTYRSPADQKPGDLTGFGFGNVRTGQVSTRKITFLTRASSEDRGELNPEVHMFDSQQSRSARASPLPQMSLQKFQDQPIDDVKGPKSVQWSQQSSAIAKTDFASSTKALGSGLVRSSKSASTATSAMATSTKSESQSLSKASFIQESAASFATQSKMEFSSSSSKSSSSSFQLSKT